MKSDLVDLDMKMHYQTDKAVHVSLDGNEAKAVWLPRSQIELEAKPKGIVRVTLPEWLAIKKGLA